VNVPPRTGKSLTVSVAWPTWLWIHHPGMRLLFASYAAMLATRDALRSRRLIQSSWWQARWGDRFALTGDQNEKTRYENDAGGLRLATSVGGSATGEGGDVLVVDDPHKLEDAYSDAARLDAIRWWDGTMSSRMNDPRTGRMVVVMQRVHEQDLTGHLLAEQPGDWHHLALPMRHEPSHPFRWPDDPRTEPGALLWPERMPEPEVQRLERALGARTAAGQLQQRPSPDVGAVFQRSWWRSWRELPADVDEWLESWDMAYKDERDSDYVVGQLWARAGARFYLAGQVRQRMAFPETLAAMRLGVRPLVSHESYAAGMVGTRLVEDTANGPAIVSTLRQEVPGIVAVTPRGGKVARAAAVSPLAEAGNVYLPARELWPAADELVDELATFPQGAHDDQVDALSQALSRLRSTTITRERLAG
jgi:predicted phage terminase large subunit-like protein